MRVEVLLDNDLCMRGRVMLQAMIDAVPAGITLQVSRKGFTNSCDVLMTYGTGHAVRRPYWQAQRQRGARCIGWDLGYWKHPDSFTMRATIDEDHPQAFIRDEPAGRWDAQGIELRSDADEAGPIVIVGMGPKSVKVQGRKVLQWESQTLHRLRGEYPDRVIAYRPKHYVPPFLSCPLVTQGPIDEALRGVALIVCRHSNVAVDACIAGVPVICEDGAAFALYQNNSHPTPDQRLHFLRSLAYWQWTPAEANDAWTYLISRL